MAAETFYHNLIAPITDTEEWRQYCSSDTSVMEQAKNKLIVKELSSVLNCAELMSQLKKNNIDLIAGGPPCQGFSLAGRRKPDDIRNQLPWQFLELVEVVQPKAVLIENVSGMAQDFKKHGIKSPFGQLRIALSNIGDGYKVQPLLLNAMHFGVPQHRPRVFLIGIRNDLAQMIDLALQEEIWKSSFDQVSALPFISRPHLAPRSTHFGDDILTVADAFADLNGRGYIKPSSTAEYAKEMRNDTSWSPHVKATKAKLTNHNLRKHAAHIKLRFSLYQYFRDCNINSRVLSLPKKENITSKELKTLIGDSLLGVKFPAKASDGTIIAKNKNKLIDLIILLSTKKHSQRPLNWDQPAPTVVSLPDDYVHPDEPRTLTVREMARLQSFPDAFEFRSKETTGSLRRRFEVPQYTQVGNAVPPKLAKAVGYTIHSTLVNASNVLINSAECSKYKKSDLLRA